MGHDGYENAAALAQVNAKQFRRFVERDGGCIHCGELEAIAPHHRLGRGMGGSKARDVPSNIIVLCSRLNQQVEDNAEVAAKARKLGWKLQSWQDPLSEPFWHFRLGWVMIDDGFGLIPIVGPADTQNAKRGLA